VLRVVGYHEIFGSLHAAQFNLSFQPTVVQIFAIRAAHHVHFVLLVLNFDELVKKFSSADGVV
jgi:hypothetical protein